MVNYGGERRWGKVECKKFSRSTPVPVEIDQQIPLRLFFLISRNCGEFLNIPMGRLFRTAWNSVNKAKIHAATGVTLLVSQTIQAFLSLLHSNGTTTGIVQTGLSYSTIFGRHKGYVQP